MPVEIDGNGIITGVSDFSSSNVSLTDPEIAGGVYLGGTGSANYLDDYEEGTFSLTLDIVSGGSPDFTNTLNGRYIKVGKMVHCEIPQVLLDGSNSISVNDRFYLDGLPFATESAQSGLGNASIHASWGSGVTSHWVTRAIFTQMRMWCIHTDGAPTYGDNFASTVSYEVD